MTTHMTRQTLGDLFPSDSPFGPTATPDSDDPDMFIKLVDKTNLIYQEMRNHPTMIVGRRGSGKTTFLRTVMLDQSYQIVVELPPEDAFRQVINSIEQMSTKTVFVEEVASLWNVVLWSTLLNELVT